MHSNLFSNSNRKTEFTVSSFVDKDDEESAIYVKKLSAKIAGSRTFWKAQWYDLTTYVQFHIL